MLLASYFGSDLLGRFEPTSGEDPLSELGRAAAAAGLHVSRFSAPLSVALRATAGDRPLFTVDSEGHPVGLTRRLGRRVRLERPGGEARWVELGALAEILGFPEDAEHEWLAPEEIAAPQEREPSPWRQVVGLLRPDAKDVAVIAVYAAGVGVLSLALPVAVQVLVNTVAFGTVMQPIVVLSLLLGAGLLFAAAMWALQMWVVEIVQRRLFVRLVSTLADRLPRVHVRAFERVHGPELVNRFFDVFTAQKAVASLLLGGIEATLTVLVGLVMLALYHPLLLLFGVLLIAGIAVIALLGRGASRTTIEESRCKYAVAGWLEEMARHLFALKLAGGGEFARRRLDDLAGDWLDARHAHFRIVFRQILATLGLRVVASVALLGVGGWLVIERELTLGQLVAAELIVSAVVGALLKLANKLDPAYDLVAAADKLGVLFSLPVERQGGERLRAAGAVSVRLDGVASHNGTLRGVNVEVPAGGRLWVKGSGRARQTFTELLFGMREPAEGVVFIGGKDCRDLDLGSLRARVAVVRDAETLPGTVADNLRASGRRLSSDEIWELLDRVGLGARVRALPDGIATELLPNAAPLSYDEALRLTLARALATKPSLLVLDGVLGPLEFAPDALEAMFEGRTVIALGDAPLPDAPRLDLEEGR